MKWFSFVVALVLASGLGCSGKKETTKEGDKELSLTPPLNTSIKQDTAETVDVKIKRVKFDDPVTVEISDLPDKVTAEESKKTIAKDADKATFTLKAAKDAPVTDGTEVKFTAKTDALKTTTTAKFKLSVKKKD